LISSIASNRSVSFIVDSPTASSLAWHYLKPAATLNNPWEEDEPLDALMPSSPMQMPNRYASTRRVAISPMFSARPESIDGAHPMKYYRAIARGRLASTRCRPARARPYRSGANFAYWRVTHYVDSRRAPS
jgi:hypothetical protein